MTLIAIDPGTHESAVLEWNGVSPIGMQIVSNAELLRRLRGNATRLPIACECVASYGMAVGKEVFETCFLIGRIQEIAHQNGSEFHKIYRKDVKMHLCHSMKAKDANIRQSLIDRLGKVGTKKTPGPLFGISSHLWAALAVAVYAHDTISKPQPLPLGGGEDYTSARLNAA